MTDAAACPLCEVVAGIRQVPGGILLRHDGFILHAVAAATPVAGWLVLTTERHVRGVYSLEPADAGALGVLCTKVMRAQLAALGAEHVYQFAIGDQVHHCHVHLVPRFANTPANRRGAKCFDVAPEEALGHDLLANAATLVAAELRKGLLLLEK